MGWMRRVRIKRKQKVKGKGRGRERREGNWKWSFGRKEKKIANAPAENRIRDPSKHSWYRCSSIEPPTQATSPASWFDNFIRPASTSQSSNRRHPMSTDYKKPALLGGPVTIAIVHHTQPDRIVKRENRWTNDQGKGPDKYYRKRGSASYIVREVRSVREREREREPEVTSP